jgi:hypothetical protein
MRSAFPNRTFEAPDGNPDTIVADGVKLGLENLRRKYALSDKNDQTLKELVVEQVTLASHRTSNALRFPKSFEEARERILPQLMPPAIATDSGQVRIPFAGNLFIGLVADDDRAYMYVSTDALRKWGKSREELYTIALQNLDSRSKGVKMEQFTNSGLTLIAVDAADGYAAARIVLPGIRKVIGERLGRPFFFGIPNRDFLICWSEGGGAESAVMVRDKLNRDFQERPYPLSAAIFRVATDDTITEQTEAK